ncbi:MAG TPA: DUF4105 domain-containing protein [Chitinophagaceae bacterium]|nr:DUF4105 domain-containing protein [Chitinophagaceae bacterium]
MMRIFLSFLLLLNIISGNAQDSCRMRVSLLTCSPGSELYSIFGHSALRIVDSSVGTDIVYNYGTFDFGDPDFYSKFVRGKLLYFVSQESFPDFAATYVYEQRTMDEQILNFSCDQKKQIQSFIYNNLQGDNKFYKYDFLYDNCTTRLRDIIEKFRNKDLKEGPVKIAEGMTFRNGIHYYLDHGEMHWSKFGIDLLLGSRIDKKMTTREAMFLPEFLEASIDRTGNGTDSLVIKKEYPLTLRAEIQKTGLFEQPLTIFSILALLIFALGFSKNPASKKLLIWIDSALFLILGLLGCLFLFMWVGTDHKQTADNYNLLWAWPVHIIAPFLLYRPSPNARRYFFIYMIVTGITLLSWVILPQQLNPALIPILLIAMYRCWKIYSEHGTINKKSS